MTNLSRLGTHPPACIHWQKNTCKNRNCPFLHQTFVLPSRPLGLPMGVPLAGCVGVPMGLPMAGQAGSVPVAAPDGSAPALAAPAPVPAPYEVEACRHGNACKYLARGSCRFRH